MLLAYESAIRVRAHISEHVHHCLSDQKSICICLAIKYNSEVMDKVERWNDIKELVAINLKMDLI